MPSEDDPRDRTASRALLVAQPGSRVTALSLADGSVAWRHELGGGGRRPSG